MLAHETGGHEFVLEQGSPGRQPQLTWPHRSAIVDGMTAATATELATVAAGGDADLGLRAARALRRLAEALETMQVYNARRSGWSWQEIAAALEISKQAVHKKYARRTPPT